MTSQDNSGKIIVGTGLLNGFQGNGHRWRGIMDSNAPPPTVSERSPLRQACHIHERASCPGIGAGNGHTEKGIVPPSRHGNSHPCRGITLVDKDDNRIVLVPPFIQCQIAELLLVAIKPFPFFTLRRGALDMNMAKIPVVALLCRRTPVTGIKHQYVKTSVRTMTGIHHPAEDKGERPGNGNRAVLIPLTVVVDHGLLQNQDPIGSRFPLRAFRGVAGDEEH